ncbi:rhodanese-like domain-containing protein [Actinobacteria bacterium YIM 96077]|uniref:Rhodanese-like domain-containing protein n=1 Tax=Phytoactinopolyspora halophila TaxID=1981511 RepID=A0A329R0N7_9ACTN|nr:rhodanese-like domain-containing protein [Actinobacteria bacterium YIM 96077]RAW18200.1 rhodanese-like domain-containing protein [Phytoactinopolyspora halophila]
MWRAGDLVIDVRLPEEYASGHIAGAINIPLRELPTRLRDLPAGQVITVCSTGIRSRRGAETVARLGRTAFTVRGGTKAWTAAGYPIATGPEPGMRRRHSFWRRLASRMPPLDPR